MAIISSQLAAPSVVHSVERRAQAVALRRQGYPYTRIGQIMGCTKQTAWKLVVDSLEERRRELGETVDQLRSIEHDRLEKLMLKLFRRFDDPKNENPERTADSILRVSERISSLFGLDAPKDYRITPGGSHQIPAGGEIDVTKLSTEELRELERLQVAYDALVARSAPPALPPGELVKVVERPTEEARYG